MYLFFIRSQVVPGLGNPRGANPNDKHDKGEDVAEDKEGELELVLGAGEREKGKKDIVDSLLSHVLRAAVPLVMTVLITNFQFIFKLF